ncbi:MAG: DUF6421 family protein, partial [Microbacteriaceae bacterium]
MTTQLARPEIVTHVAWLTLKSAAAALQTMQVKDGSIPDSTHHSDARRHVEAIQDAVRTLSPYFPHDESYLEAVVADFGRWVESDFAEPDFLASILEFSPASQRMDGVRHLVVFPMYTQNGSANRFVEAVLIEVMWPEFIAELEAGDYGNKMFLPLSFLDFTSGYDTNSAVLFPESVAMREVPTFTWGAIFQDREAARFRTVIEAAVDITSLELPAEAEELLNDTVLAQHTFIMWDMIHDGTHMDGDLPFDQFM